MNLQVQYTVADFLGAALVPELGADIAAGTAGYSKLVLVAVAAVRAFPYKLAGFILLDQNLTVKTTAFAVIAFGIQLSIHDIFINELHDA